MERDLEKRMNITYMFTVHVFDHLVRGENFIQKHYEL